MLIRLVLCCFALCAACAATAHGFKTRQFSIIHPFVEPAPSGTALQIASMTIRNLQGKPDRLLRVEAAVSRFVELRGAALGSSETRLEKGIVIPANGVVVLALGQHYVAFVDLTEDFYEWTEFPATLVFERAGRVPVTFMVEKAN